METNYVITPNAHVLVLNSTYEPIAIQSWKKAILKVVKNKARLVGNNIIKLVSYVKLPYKRVMSCYPTRKQVFKRDNHECQYCGAKEDLTLDHVIPQSKGGEDTWENLVTCCISCNSKKGNKLLHETNMVLRSTPAKPFNKINLDISRSNNTEWKAYSFI
jgi:hypothetical protein